MYLHLSYISCAPVWPLPLPQAFRRCEWRSKRRDPHFRWSEQGFEGGPSKVCRDHCHCRQVVLLWGACMGCLCGVPASCNGLAPKRAAWALPPAESMIFAGTAGMAFVLPVALSAIRTSK